MVKIHLNYSDLVQHRAVLSFQCVTISTALTWSWGTQLPFFKRDTYAATFHSCEFIPVTLMEAVQALMSYTKVKVSNVQMKHRLGGPIFLQVPPSQGGLGFTDDKEELPTSTTLFVSSHTVNRYPPSTSLLSWWPVGSTLSPSRDSDRKAGIYIMCEEYW